MAEVTNQQSMETSINVSSTAMTISKTEITLPQPNYPHKSGREPIFYIPKLPELTKVPDPAPPRKAPPTGFDVRTLRKQLEFLQSEITARSETQELLYRQNSELLEYSRALTAANRQNAGIMRDQVTTLHEEMRTLHQERRVLSEKLTDAENSK